MSITTLLGLDAIRTSDRSFWVLILCSMLMMIPFSFYNVYANPFLDDIGVTNPAATQTIGQVSEVGFLLLLPLFFRWVGIKGVLFIGMAAWAVRYVIFANGFTADGPIEPLIYLGLALHGVGFDFVVRRGDDLGRRALRRRRAQPGAILPRLDDLGGRLSDRQQHRQCRPGRHRPGCRAASGRPSGCCPPASPR